MSAQLIVANARTSGLSSASQPAGPVAVLTGPRRKTDLAHNVHGANCAVREVAWPATSASTGAANVAGTRNLPQWCCFCTWLVCRLLDIIFPEPVCVSGAPPCVRSDRESCHPAAGSAATLVPELRLRRVRKWLQSHIRAHARCSMDALLQALLHRVQAADASCACAILGQASRALCVEGRAFCQEGDLYAPPSAAIWLTTAFI